jgi:NAD(P)H-dependent flavin oxidoreductase YrpB (nitropropane dioxygenase family)
MFKPLWDGLNLLTPRWNVQYDYTNGQLTELVDIIIASKAKLFICAIGVPPREVIERLHKAGIVVMKCVYAVAHLTSKQPVDLLT